VTFAHFTSSENEALAKKQASVDLRLDVSVSREHSRSPSCTSRPRHGRSRRHVAKGRTRPGALRAPAGLHGGHSSTAVGDDAAQGRRGRAVPAPRRRGDAYGVVNSCSIVTGATRRRTTAGIRGCVRRGSSRRVARGGASWCSAPGSGRGIVERAGAGGRRVGQRARTKRASRGEITRHYEESGRATGSPARGPAGQHDAGGSRESGHELYDGVSGRRSRLILPMSRR